MLQINNVPPIRLLSIDPGTATMGAAIMEMRPDSPIVNVLYTNTLRSGPHVSEDHILSENFGVREHKICWYRDQVYYHLAAFLPAMVIAEAPYQGRFATSFEALTEVKAGIKAAIQMWNPGLYFETIEPLNAKMSVGLKLTRENRKDKDAVRNCIIRLSNIHWLNGTSPANCTEHEIDAIAVGYWKISQLWNLYQGRA